MLRITAVIILALTTMVWADTPTQTLVNQERRALRAVPDEKLQSLLVRPESKVQYTRDWLLAQPAAEGGAEWRCLAEALYFESRGESVQGQFAVAEVILNRVDNSRFPSNICAVVHQGTGRKHACQFSFTCDGHPEVISEPAAFKQVGKVAKLMVDGAARSLTQEATYFHTLNVRPSWARKFTRTTTIGVHHFYFQPARLTSN